MGDAPERISEQPGEDYGSAQSVLGSFARDAAGDELMRARIHRRLMAEPRIAPLALHTRRRWWAHPVLASMLLLTMTAVAGATVGRRWVIETWTSSAPREAAPRRRGLRTHHPAPEDRADNEASQHPIPETTAHGPTAAASAQPPPKAPTAIASPHARYRKPVPRRHRPRAQRRRHALVDRADGGDIATRPAPSNETLLLLDAVSALRSEGAPARAQALLRRYLERFPNGILLEEALALSLEAAQKRGDGSAAERARAYLDRFPSGRFADAARAASREAP